MDNLLNEDPLFNTLLQSGGEGPITTQTFSQHSNVVVASTPLHGGKRPPTKKVQRGASFTVEEDNVLVSGWLNISIDTIQGTDQKSTQMWERVSEFYHEYKKPQTMNRSVESLINRWSMIQKCTNKFCLYLAQVESLHPSGATEQDKIEKAKILYKEMERGNFTMDHSWNLLRHQPKWHQHMNTLNTRRKPHDKRHSNEQSSEVLGDIVEEHVERPAGKKAEKENLRKRKAQESSDADFNMALGAMTEDRRLFMAERREWQTKVDRDRCAQLELDKRKFDAEMMSKDLSGMNVMQQAYFHKVQKKKIGKSQ
ncbi:hypothetical protein CIPAW_03G069900 [Carya illinoinensis]|uniref:No apical meristem-associated C-terminal domain-containing protein n=1 Tax=Carya illinoinensis TaxID=32201 RepID=A0A8T1R1F9_CARIL|nr:hypothetical protein CIPAW_03G069900 [Carya illinoinensis]